MASNSLISTSVKFDLPRRVEYTSVQYRMNRQVTPAGDLCQPAKSVALPTLRPLAIAQTP